MRRSLHAYHRKHTELRGTLVVSSVNHHTFIPYDMLHVIHLMNILHFFLSLGNTDVWSSGLGTSIPALGAVIDAGGGIMAIAN